MQTQQFTGDTVDDVLAQVRGAFGEDAVILETRNVVRGGFAGFFGRAGIEVTAADRMPGDAGGIDLLDTDTGAAGDGAGGATHDDFLRRLGEHLAPAEDGGRSAAPPPAAAQPEAGPGAAAGAAPDGARSDERDRARAIIEAARAAVREAAGETGGADTPAEGAPTADAAPATPARRAAPATLERPADPEPARVETPARPAPFVPGIAIRPEEEPAPAGGPPRAVPPAQAAPAPAPARPVPVRAEVAAVRDELIAAGVDERRLESLLDGFSRSVVPFLAPEAPVRAAVRDYLAARMPVVRDWRPWRAAHTIALVGQSGVGKTASAVKIAARHAGAGLDVAIVAAGGSAHGPLARWAQALDISMVEAPDPAALRAAMARLGARDLILVDTPGCGHADADGLRGLTELLEAAGADEVHLVLPAVTPAEDLGDLQGAFRPLGVNRVTVTKVDETRRAGGLLNAPMRVGRPLAYIADGPGAPGSITPADPRLVAERLLPGS